MEKNAMLFAVNGTLMRDLELNENLVAVGAAFVREGHTAPVYRLWTINDDYPAMIKDASNGASISLELWDVDCKGIVEILLKEPEGLSVGKIELDNGELVLGVLAEPYIIEDESEITQYCGWRAYLEQQAASE
jgi:gamma-glutamylcyclotransferase (GGCT)/AIG2-like uncharacterized protein YtfP